MQLVFDTVNMLVALAGAANLIYGLVVWQRGRGQLTNQTFFFFAVSVAAWSIAMVLFRSATSAESAFVTARFLYVVAALIPLAFVYFSFAFEITRTYSFTAKFLVAIPTVVVLVLAIVPGLLIYGVKQRPGLEPVIQFDPYFHFVYLLYVCLYATAVFIVLLTRFLKSEGMARNRIYYILVGTSLPWTVGITTNVILPLFDNFDYNWMGQISTFFSTTVISYGIFRSRLFDVRIIATELLVFMLWVGTFVQILIAESLSATVFNTVVFLLLVIAGYLLIRSVYREVEQREEIEKLSEEKSEFMTFASHEIRNPITAMRGYASLVVEGTAGEASPQVRDIASKILVLGDDVLALIGQFLSKSKMELGQIQFNAAAFDLGAAVSSIADGYKPHAAQKGLQLIKKIDPAQKFIVTADEPKVKEVVGNIIDNSLKYTKAGNITVTVERHGIATRVVVSDTGVGIPPETLPHLFKKFSRADAQKVNILGTGVGLYLAKTFIEGMKGRIWAESDGAGKGSRFIIEFPS